VNPHLILGSRGSDLALAQVQLVRDALLRAHPALSIDVKIITTSGDRRQELKAGEGSNAGLKGLFTKEIQDALLAGSIDAAIHSLKDLPGITPAGLEVTAVLERADPSDILLSRDSPGLASLRPGARVGTGSVRRGRQLKWLRPDLEILDLRGNVPTRLEKLAAQPLDAIVLARAGLERLGHTISAGILSGPHHFHAMALDILPAIGQGAIGIEIHAGNTNARALFAPIDHEITHNCIRVERALLRLLDGDCRLPVAARVTQSGSLLHAQALVFPDDETLPPAQARSTGPASAPESLAQTLFLQISQPRP